jgi:predicted double-glycine peptidase
VQQKTDFSCGAAALATILRQAYWLDVNEEQIIEGMLANSDHDLVRVQGFSMLDMKRYVESIGMRARGYRVAQDTLSEIKIPVVVLMDIRGYKHFVVMQRVHNGWVYIGDPVLGHKRYKVDDFVKGWNGIIFAVIGQGYDKTNGCSTHPATDRQESRQHLQPGARHRVDGFRIHPKRLLLITREHDAPGASHEDSNLAGLGLPGRQPADARRDV